MFMSIENMKNLEKIRDMFSHISNFYYLDYFLFFNTTNVIVIPAIRIKAIAPPNT